MCSHCPLSCHSRKGRWQNFWGKKCHLPRLLCLNILRAPPGKCTVKALAGPALVPRPWGHTLPCPHSWATLQSCPFQPAKTPRAPGAQLGPAPSPRLLPVPAPSPSCPAKGNPKGTMGSSAAQETSPDPKCEFRNQDHNHGPVPLSFPAFSVGKSCCFAPSLNPELGFTPQHRAPIPPAPGPAQPLCTRTNSKHPRRLSVVVALDVISFESTILSPIP